MNKSYGVQTFLAMRSIAIVKHGVFGMESEQEVESVQPWIRIIKPKLEDPPFIPDGIDPWVKDDEIHNSSLNQPNLYDQILITIEPENDEDETKEEIVKLADHPEIVDMWSKYIEECWKPWAKEDLLRRHVLNVYNNLFTIYQRQQKLGEQYEVVLGLGFMTWQAPKSGHLRRHTLTVNVEIIFNPVNAHVTVHPAGGGASLNLEADLLDLEDQPLGTERKIVEDLIRNQGDDVWREQGLREILSAWVNSLPADSGKYEHSLKSQTGVSKDPLICLAPAIILRKRSQQTMIQLFQNIIDQLNNGSPIPSGIYPIIEIAQEEGYGQHIDSTTERPNISYEPEETDLYFPLSANNEQKEIAWRIDRDVGVLVQGPPGTGKSHTIVNLVCHLLAKGKRVLVTSHTVRALSVLRGKFPKEIEKLCVLLLGNDREGMSDLEKSVLGITERKNHWSWHNSDQNLKRLEDQLDEIRRRKATLLHDLRSIREKETYRYNNLFERYSGTAQQIAIQVHNEQQHLGWIEDSPEVDIPPPLSNEEMQNFLQMWHEVYKKNMENEIIQERVSTEELPNPEIFSSLVEEENRAIHQLKSHEKYRNYPAYSALKTMPSQERIKFTTNLSYVVDKLKELANHFHSWAENAAREIIAEQDRVWRELLRFTKEQIQAIDKIASRISTMTVTGLEEHDYTRVVAKAEALLQHLNSGKKLGIGFIRARVVKDAIYLIQEVRIEGKLCNNVNSLCDLVDWLKVHLCLKKLETLWEGRAEIPKGLPTIKLEYYKDLCEPLEDALGLHNLVLKLRHQIDATPGLSPPKWYIVEEVHAMCKAAEVSNMEERQELSTLKFVQLQKILEKTMTLGNPHQAVAQLFNAITNRDKKQYKKVYDYLITIDKWNDTYRRMSTIRDKFKQIAQKTFNTFNKDWNNNIWVGRFNNFCNAWNWSRANRWLDELCDPTLLTRKVQLLEDVCRKEGKYLALLAAEKAWRECIQNLSEERRRYLEAWMQAVKKITKSGRGKYDESRRATARANMAKCRNAIPAWVMPIYRVVESITPGQDSFDVVIIDEASQSGPEAVFLHYIAPKVIVVGDDKQIRPTHVGIHREQVLVLQREYLQDIPHSESLDLEGSFFSQAAIRYANQIRLREHFRCMPEIIGFSNRNFYKTEPLIPLRQFGSNRLEPVVCTHFVKDAYMKGKDNPVEAEAIVHQIIECCEDPAYEGKTFGVISLVSTSTQDRLIEKMLLQSIGADEMNARQLICGDSYTFQGDERDVIFLSMVVAPELDTRIKAITGAEAERRYNVGASRAKDQMWLFHSSSLNDLNPIDLRYKLLEYCLNPTIATTVVGDISVKEIQHLASTQNRSEALPPEPFESWFEVDVFLQIVERGYKVIPQFEIAGYRIDLVVEGLKNRLAVECDGDNWHGPDRFDQDMARERDLRRCKWNFWRVRGSDFYRDPITAMVPLWEELSKAGIHSSSTKNNSDSQNNNYDESLSDQEDLTEEEDLISTKIQNEKAFIGIQDRLNSALNFVKKKQALRRPDDVTPTEIKHAIIHVLRERSNNTCAVKNMAAEVLQHLGLITRAGPRQKFDSRVKRAIKALCRIGTIKEYRTQKNKRIKLI